MSDNKKMMEIAEKIIKEYSKDFNTDIIDMYRVDFDNMKALCDKEFEKNGVKTDYEYQSVDALSQKRDFMVLDAYVKGESDRYETPHRECDIENIVKYAANYEKEVSDGERKPTLEQTGRLAKLYKREMKKDMDDLLKIADARSFAERMDKYIAESSSKDENVQQAYKAIDDFIYEKIPENEFDKVMQSQTPETIKDAFDKVIEDMGTIPFGYPEYDGSYGKDAEVDGDFRAPAVLHIYENYIKDNIKDISKEPANIKAIDAVSKDTKEYEQIYPKEGWVEHNPMEIWSSQLGVAIEAMAMVNVPADDIEAIGITNQRETTIIWDKKTGKPVYNAIVWQCRRTADSVEKIMHDDNMADIIKKKTGLIPDAYFSATKIAWILDNVDGAREKAENGELAFGTVDTWLIWNLTKGKVHATDYTNAARTMLFNIHTLEWDKELMEYFNIPENMLPQVKPSSCIYGETDKSVFGSSIIIAGAAGDQQSALFGQCCFNPGEVKNTYGTGCFLLMNTGNNPIYSDNGLLTTLAAGSTKDKPEYALEGSVFVAGAVVQWLRDELRMIKDAASTKEYAMKVENTAGVYIVPAFSGLGAPYWNPYARGTVVGLTRGTKKEHFIRAALESIAYQADDVIRAMEKSADIKLSGLKVDGGASANEFLMQFQSDITGESVIRPSCIETTALGAAYLAGLATGYWKDKDEIKKNWRLGAEYDAHMSTDERRKLLKNWKHAVNSALFWAEAAEK